jgi:hypothetical protein
VNKGAWDKGSITADAKRGIAELKFTSEGADVPLGPCDQRLTKFIIKNIRIELLK